MDIQEIVIAWLEKNWPWVLLIVGGAILYEVLVRRRIRSERDREAQNFGRTTTRSAGSLGAERLNPGLDAMASIGRDAAPTLTIDTWTLRPTLGLRLISLGLGAVIVAMMWGGLPLYQDVGDQMPDAAKWFITAVVALATFNVMTYEVRVSERELHAKKYFLFPRTYLWKDLVLFQHDGGYEYVMRFDPGGRITVLKHLAGIEHLQRIAGRSLRTSLE